MNNLINLQENSAYRPLNYTIQNNDQEDTAIIDIDGFIGQDIFMEWMTGEKSPNTVASLKEQLRSITAKKIIVNINSPGGDLNDGLVIMEMLQQKKAEVVTNLQGFCASAATVIALAGDKRRMSINAFSLIHRVMFGVCGFFNQNTIRAMLPDMETIDKRLIKAYARAGNITEEEIGAIMDEGEGYGRWMDADEALEYGFVTEIYDPADSEDEDVDRMTAWNNADEMKRNVQELAVQAMKMNFKTEQGNFSGVNETPGFSFFNAQNEKKELHGEQIAAKEARNQLQLLKLKYEV
jgi:ATP-dependent protease ClpP protease subunit